MAQSFRRQHNQGEQKLSGITRRMVRALPRVFTAEQSEDIHRSRVTLGEIKEAVKAVKEKKSPGVDELVAEAYQHLEAPELDGLAGRVLEVLRTGEPPREWGGKVRPLYKKGNHLRPGNWRPICCAVTEAKLVWMVIFGRIQWRLYAAGVIPDNMWGSVPGRSTQETSFLYDMYLDDEDLEAFIASVDVKGAFPNTPQRLIEEVWRQLGLPYGDLVEKYLRSRRYTVATGKGCTEWVGPGCGVPQGGVEGPFLYLLAMLPLMSWIAREYPQLARAPHTSPAQAYVDDAVPMARVEKARQVVQDLMQRYGRDNHLVWSAEKSAVLRRGGEEGMALDVGDGVAWLERAEEAVVLGHVQAMEARGVRLPDKLVRGFRAMLVVLRHHPPSVQTTLYYLRALLNAAVGYQAMHLPYWIEQLEEVEREVRRLIRGYEGIPTEVPWCVLRSPTAYYGEGMPTAGEAYRAHTARTLSRMCHNQEEVVRRVCYHAVAEVQKEENMCPRYVWHRRRRLAAGKKERMWRPYRRCCRGKSTCWQPTGRAVGEDQSWFWTGTSGGAAHGTVRWIRKEGVSIEVLHVRRKDMKEYKMAGLHHAEFYRDTRQVEWGVYRWMMRRARGQEDRTRWSRRMRKMWKEWVALWGIQKRKPRCWRGEGAQQEGVVLDRAERDKARLGILLCAPLGLKGPRGKVQSATGQWYDAHADMFRKDNIPEGAGQGDQCWRSTKEAGQIPWPVLRMTAWAFPNATMRTTDTRGQWWGPVLRLPKEVREDEEAQGDVEVWWGEEKEEKRTGVKLG